MTVQAWHEEPIARKHDRKSFDCGQDDLNRFLQQYARQAHEHGASKTYVAVADTDGTTILGYYTLSPAHVDFHRVPEVARLNLGRHAVGGFRLARLAVSKSLQGQGFGGQLLVAAARRCMRASQEVGGTALLIDAKDESVAQWYSSYGAVRLIDTPLSLLLPYGLLTAALRKKPWPRSRKSSNSIPIPFNHIQPKPLAAVPDLPYIQIVWATPMQS